MLVSANFLASVTVERERVLLMEKRDQGLLAWMPVLLKTCAWQRIPWLAGIKLVPDDGLPIQRGDAKARFMGVLQQVLQYARKSAKPGDNDPLKQVHLYHDVIDRISASMYHYRRKELHDKILSAVDVLAERLCKSDHRESQEGDYHDQLFEILKLAGLRVFPGVGNRPYINVDGTTLIEVSLAENGTLDQQLEQFELLQLSYPDYRAILLRIGQTEAFSNEPNRRESWHGGTLVIDLLIPDRSI